MSTEPPRKTDTRQALLDAALQVFLQRGFARATTREIAQTAGVAEGTIYRHFADKYALFHEVFLSLTARSWPSSSGSASEPATARSATTWSTCSRWSAASRSSCRRSWRRCGRTPSWPRNIGARARELAPEGFVPPGPVAMVAEYIRAEQELGRIRSDVDATEAAAVVVSVPVRRRDGARAQHASRRDRRVPRAGRLPDPGGQRPRHPGARVWRRTRLTLRPAASRRPD